MTNRATYPDTLVPSALDAGEDYASVADILQCEDLPHATLKVPFWRKNGQPMPIRVRALSLAQRETVQRESTRRDGTIDITAQLCATVREGCVAPTFTAEQAAALGDKNPTALEQIASFIWALSSLDQDWIDGLVQSRTNAAPESAAAEPAAPANSGRTSGIRRVA